MKYLTLSLLVASVAVWSYFLGAMSPSVQHDNLYVYTKNVCDKAHDEDNGGSEELCGQLQDQTNTEYTCNNNASYCWLEVK